jgi:hypothetical protein
MWFTARFFFVCIGSHHIVSFFGFHSFIATDIVYDLYTIKSLISKKSLFVCSWVLFVFDFEFFSLFFKLSDLLCFFLTRQLGI